MANWCSNVVEFIGEQDPLNKMKRLFDSMAAVREQKERKGQKPGFVSTDTGFLFQVRWEDGMLFFDTKWAPDIEAMVQVADHYGVGFVYSYSETANLIYGEATYRDGVLTDILLDIKDFNAYKLDEETDRYVFEKGNYESNEEILDILLKRKKAINGLH